MKAIVPCGGAGTRLRPITHTSAKQLVPVANKPVLFYAIESLAAAGIRDVGIIIAPETGDELRGLAHAVLTAEDFLGDSPFVMYLGDNLLRDGIVELVDQFKSQEPDAL